MDFERPILELERKIEDLRKFGASENMDLSAEISKLEKRLVKMKREIFENITPWQRVQLARHPQRPYTLDYIKMIMTDFIELHGDRCFGEDRAIVGGLAKLNGRRKVVVIGHQKGRGTKDNIMRNFGSAQPEGYRKALRIMKLAEKFKLPVISFVDTPGAYPGIGAEERGQASAIAYTMREMAMLKVPILVYVIGEGGSGGAIGIGIGDRIAVLENAYYSVISPEGCAAILWRDRTKMKEAAAALKLTARDLLELGVIDEIIPEPLGGAHREPQQAAEAIKAYSERSLEELSLLSAEKLVELRYAKFRNMGVFAGGGTSDV